MTKAKTLGEEQVRRAISLAAREQEVTETEAWDALSILSNNTQVESLEIFEDEISISGDRFQGPIVWHVDLVYGDAGDDIHQSDSFPGTVSGHIDGRTVVVERMTADTRSFYS